VIAPAIACLDGLEDREDRVAARAFGPQDRIDHGRIDGAIVGHPARQQRGQIDAGRALR
jgi:hypothetical protein